MGQRIRALFAPLQRLAERFRRLSRAAGLDRLARGFSGVGRGISNVAGKAKEAFGAVAKYAGAAAIAVGAFVVTQAEAGDELAKSSQRVGLSVDAFAQLSAVAAGAGIDMEKFTTSIDTFNKSLGEAKLGKGKLAAFLKSVSPNLLKGLKGAKDTETALDIVFAAFDRLDDAGKKAAVSSKVFGNVDMTKLLAEGLPAIIAQRKAFEKLWGSQQKFVDGAQDLDDQLDGLKGVFLGLSRGVATQLFPAFAKLAEQLSQFLLKNKDQILAWARVAGDKLMRFAEDLPGNLRKIADSFREIKSNVKPVTDLFGGFGNTIAILAGLIVGGPLLAAIASMTVSFVALGVAIGATPVGWFIAGIAAIAAGALLVVKNWSSIKEFFTEMWQDVKDVFSGFTDFLTGVFTLDLKRAWDGIKRVFGSQKDLAKKSLQLSLLTNPLTAPLAIARSLLPKTGSPSMATAAQPRSGSPQSPAQFQRPIINAQQARPRAAVMPQQPAPAKAQVTVNFKNTPPGTRVKQEPGGTVDLVTDVGYPLGFQR